MIVNELYTTPWISLRLVQQPDAGVNGYVYSHETRCKGRIVAVLPYRHTAARGNEYLLRSEITPCWSMKPLLSAITGGWEGGDIRDDAVRELLEETGYTAMPDEMTALGESYASKSSDTTYSLFTVDLTGREPGELTGDGSPLDAYASAVWVKGPDLADVMDPQVSVLFLRLNASRWKRMMEGV